MNTKSLTRSAPLGVEGDGVVPAVGDLRSPCRSSRGRWSSGGRDFCSGSAVPVGLDGQAASATGRPGATWRQGRGDVRRRGRGGGPWTARNRLLPASDDVGDPHDTGHDDDDDGGRSCLCASAVSPRRPAGLPTGSGGRLSVGTAGTLPNPGVPRSPIKGGHRQAGGSRREWAAWGRRRVCSLDRIHWYPEVRWDLGRRRRTHPRRRRSRRPDPPPGHDVVVVVSAMGKTTDQLIQPGRLVAPPSRPRGTTCS